MNKHILIVGGGAAGCLTAIALVERGHRVTLVDKGVLGGEASWAGGGILFPLLPWKYKEPVNRLALAGAALYPALSRRLLEATGIDPEYQACGMRVISADAVETAMRWCRDNGLIAETQGQDLWLPQVAQARNPRLMRALRAFLELQGVRIVENTELTPLQPEDGRLVAWQGVDGQQFEADIFVLTAGAWSTRLLGRRALSVQVRPMRGQILLYRLEPGVLKHILYADDFYLIPRLDGHILAGSTVEDVGFDKSVTQEAATGLAARAAALLPQLANAPVVKQWSGLRPGSPDNIPVIARHPELENLYLNTGHFRYGVTMAPSSAQMLAALIHGEQPLLDAGAYAFQH